ncbi:MAG TPA: DNA translocase FtsK 4TM domain-containing protein, partial [Conexibacter sp.]|nr:DNA translocase FtsK 4TM domain-containing protein [Conexibacter sp.]
MPTKTRARRTTGSAGGARAARRPRSRAAARSRAKRSAGASIRRPALPQLTPHQLDLLGLGLAALGIFLAFVLYLGAAGGSAGGALSDGLELLLGEVAYAAPVAFVAGGALLVARTLVPSMRPVRAGTLCLFAAVTLMLAAGTLGLGSGMGDGVWSQETLKANGGAVGALLYWTTSHLFSEIGAHIIAIFLLLAGLLLLSGVTVASLLRQAADSAVTLGPRREASAPTRAPAPEPVVPPEPEDDRLV